MPIITPRLTWSRPAREKRSHQDLPAGVCQGKTHQGSDKRRHRNLLGYPPAKWRESVLASSSFVPGTANTLSVTDERGEARRKLRRAVPPSDRNLGSCYGGLGTMWSDNRQ